MIRKSIFFILLLLPQFVFAGVVNPDISVLGQIIAQRTDDTKSENTNTNTLNLGETEIVFDSYLNPYAKGFFVFTVDNSVISTEEAFLTIFKGLPDGLALKGGKYRVGFGKLNPLHPHAYSFIEAPRVMGAMLPGDDGYNETGVQASYLLPAPGSWASILSADVINGSTWHTNETKQDSGWVGRWANSVLINDTTPLDIGLSATEGTNNVSWNKKTQVYGADIKTKIAFSPLTKLTLQGEYFYNSSDVVIDTATGNFNRAGRKGFYSFFDLNFWQRYNAGIIYDQYQPNGNVNLTDSAIKYFLGFTFMEETTLLRLAYEQFMPQGSPVVNTWSLQVLFSMGPHKAHQF